MTLQRRHKNDSEQAERFTVPSGLGVGIPVIILAQPRAGSHYLASLLELNGYSYGDEVLWTQSRHERPDKIGFLVHQMRTFRTPCSSFIVHSYQAKHVAKDRESEFLDACFQPCRYVYLCRNLLHSAVSWYIADAQRWYKSWSKPAVVRDVPYSFVKIARSFNWIKRFLWGEKILQDLNAYRVTYEDLTRRRETTLRLLYAHTGIAITKTENGRAEKQVYSRKTEFIEQFKQEMLTVDEANLPEDLKGFTQNTLEDLEAIA